MSRTSTWRRKRWRCSVASDRGPLLSGVNPKNIALTLAAATVIAQTGVPAGQKAGAPAVFVLIGSLTIIGPLVVYFAMGARAERILSALQDFMAAHNAAIMIVVFLVLGAKLVGDAITGLTS